MLYKLNNGQYFYHIPKTGGRAYKKHNNIDWGGGHNRITKKQSINKTILVSLRDPVDRFLSAYYYTKLTCNVKGYVHYSNPTISKLRNCRAWKNSPLEMLQHVQKEDKLLDDMDFFDFNSMYSWCADIPKSSIELLDFGIIQREKGHPERYPEYTSHRVSIENENNISDIIDLVKAVNPNDYIYFKDVIGGEKICNGWL